MRLLNPYVYSVIVVSFITVFNQFDPSERNLAALILLSMMGAMYVVRIELFYERRYQGSTIIVFVTYYLFGLSDALIITALISLIEAIVYRSGLKKGLFNFSMDTLCLCFSSYIYIALGGTIGTALLAEDLLGLLAMIFSYHILNLLIISGVFQILQRGNYLELLKELAHDVSFSLGITAPLSIYLIFLYSPPFNYTYVIHLLFLYTVLLTIKYVFSRYIKLRQSQLSMIESLTHITDQKTNQDQHAARVGWIALQIGEKLKLPPDQLDQLYYAAMFHDIGKTSVNERIFHKKGPLTLEEQKDYESHVQFGHDWLLKIHGFDSIAKIVLHHHERWDGKGFPDRIGGQEIPYLSRILSVANQLDHFLVDNKTEAFTRLKAMGAVELDPNIVESTIELTHLLERYKDSNEITEWMKMSSYVSEVRQKIYNSELLNHFGVNLILNYEHGVFYHQTGPQDAVPCSNDVARLAEQSIKERRSIRDTMQDKVTGTIYDVYCLPMGDSANILLFDVTQVIHYEKEQEKKLKKIYKDVIYAVTQSKLMLVEPEELTTFLNGKLEAAHDIVVPSDITQCRHIIDRFIAPHIDDAKRKYQVLLCINECLTNVLKHAQQGRMKLYSNESVVRIVIEDTGSGIDLADLPKSALMQGYSTKLSLGQGFKLMMHYADRLILSTNTSGTTVLLEFTVGETESKGQHEQQPNRLEEMKYA